MTQLWPSLAAAEKALSNPLDFQEVLTRLGPRDRLNVEKHLFICENEHEPAHAHLWQQLICVLMTLAPDHTKSFGRHALQFYVPDGKYRMQVFALHDADGQISLYADDVLEEAVAAGLLTGPVMTDTYRLGNSHEMLIIETLDANSCNAQPFFKDMLGWNRRAMRVHIPLGVSDNQLRVIQHLCASAAKTWVTV
jgi:hypothetical protein